MITIKILILSKYMVTDIRNIGIEARILGNKKYKKHDKNI